MKRPPLFVVIALLVMESSASFALAQKEKLEVVYSSIGGTSIPLWIAQDRGFFERNGLETRLIYIGGGRIVAQAFAAGQIKIAVMAGPGMVSANLGGLSLRMIAGLINTSTYSLFVKPNITSPQELKGKKFGMGSFGSSPDFIMRQIFRRLGLDRGYDPRVGVAGVGDADPRGVVEVAVAVGGHEPRALPVLHDKVRDPAPYRRHDRAVGEGSGRGPGGRDGVDHRGSPSAAEVRPGGDG